MVEVGYEQFGVVERAVGWVVEDVRGWVVEQQFECVGGWVGVVHV